MRKFYEFVRKSHDGPSSLSCRVSRRKAEAILKSKKTVIKRESV
jgi:hypothetical protein